MVVLVSSLLPPNATTLERSSESMLDTVGVYDPALITSAANVNLCPSNMLSVLAWTVDAQGYSDSLSDDTKRALIRDSYYLHKIRGTIKSIKYILSIFNQSTALIEENFNKQMRNGTITQNGLYSHGKNPTSWAQWRIALNNPITIDQAKALFAAMVLIAPARCQLVSINYQQAANRRNGAITRNGNYTRGAVAQTLTGV